MEQAVHSFRFSFWSTNDIYWRKLVMLGNTSDVVMQTWQGAGDRGQNTRATFYFMFYGSCHPAYLVCYRQLLEKTDLASN